MNSHQRRKVRRETWRRMSPDARAALLASRLELRKAAAEMATELAKTVESAAEISAAVAKMDPAKTPILSAWRPEDRQSAAKTMHVREG